MKSFERINIFNYVVIGILILVVISLTLTLNNKNFDIIPMWFVESLIVGFFTLVGAGAGAFLAGIFTLRSVNRQINHAESQVERVRKNDNDSALRIINYVLVDFFAIYGFAISPFSSGNTNSVLLKNGINEFVNPIKELETLLSDTTLLSRISGNYIEEIPGELRRKVSHLKNIIRVVNMHSHSFDKNRVIGIYNEMNDIWDEIHKISKKIEKIVEDTSANR